MSTDEVLVEALRLSRRDRASSRRAALEPRRTRRAGRRSLGSRVGAPLTQCRGWAGADCRLGNSTGRDPEGTRRAACASNCTLTRALNFAARRSGTKSAAKAWATSSLRRSRRHSMNQAGAGILSCLARPRRPDLSDPPIHLLSRLAALLKIQFAPRTCDHNACACANRCKFTASARVDLPFLRTRVFHARQPPSKSQSQFVRSRIVRGSAAEARAQTQPARSIPLWTSATSHGRKNPTL
jgi:hypothetical protein